MSHKETTRVALALKYIDEERLAPTHRRGDGGDDENKQPKRRVKRVFTKLRKGVSTKTNNDDHDLRSRARHAQRRARCTRDDTRGARRARRDGRSGVMRRRHARAQARRRAKRTAAV